MTSAFKNFKKPLFKKKKKKSEKKLRKKVIKKILKKNKKKIKDDKVLLKFLGLIDLLMGLMIIILSSGLPYLRFYFFITILHTLKALIFIRDILSVIDLIIAAYTIIIPFYNNTALNIIFSIFLLYKGLRSII